MAQENITIEDENIPVKINKSNVPYYLITSKLYLSSDEEEIIVPKKYYPLYISHGTEDDMFYNISSNKHCEKVMDIKCSDIKSLDAKSLNIKYPNIKNNLNNQKKLLNILDYWGADILFKNQCNHINIEEISDCFLEITIKFLITFLVPIKTIYELYISGEGPINFYILLAEKYLYDLNNKEDLRYVLMILSNNFSKKQFFYNYAIEDTTYSEFLDEYDESYYITGEEYKEYNTFNTIFNIFVNNVKHINGMEHVAEFLLDDSLKEYFYLINQAIKINELKTFLNDINIKADEVLYYSDEFFKQCLECIDIDFLFNIPFEFCECDLTGAPLDYQSNYIINENNPSSKEFLFVSIFDLIIENVYKDSLYPVMVDFIIESGYTHRNIPRNSEKFLRYIIEHLDVKFFYFDLTGASDIRAYMIKRMLEKDPSLYSFLNNKYNWDSVVRERYDTYLMGKGYVEKQFFRKLSYLESEERVMIHVRHLKEEIISSN